MNRLILAFVVLIIGASAASAATCSVSTDFNPEFSITKIDFPQLLSAIRAGTPFTLDLDPDEDVESYRITNIKVTSDVDITARVRSTERSDGTYDIDMWFNVGEDLTIDDLSSATFEFEIEVEYTIEGEEETITLCLDISANIRGDIDRTRRLLDRTLGDLEDAESLFDILDVVLGVTRVAADLQCQQVTDRLSVLDEMWTQNCEAWIVPIAEHVISGTDKTDACGSVPEESRPSCIANMTGQLGGADCPALYARILEVEKNVTSACARIDCKPVLSLDAHRESYTDRIGVSRCSGTDTDLSDEACRTEFERVQGPYCPGVNVTELNKAAGTDRRTLSLSNLCSEAEERDPIRILKDPAADLISSTQCMCLPAMQGYLGQVERMYEYASACLFTSADNSSRNCTEATYAFLCDMAVGTALQCGGLGYHEFSGSTNVFMLPDGSALDFSDPDAADAIASGSVFVSRADANVDFDMSRLGRDICETALGDGDIDWASILDPSAGVSFESIGRLCRPDVELDTDGDPCVCDLSASGSARLCGTSAAENTCTYDVASRESTCTMYIDGPSTSQTAEDPQVHRAITELPAGIYGQEEGIVACTRLGAGGVQVTLEIGRTYRTATHRSGPVALPGTATQDSADVERIFSCENDRLRITFLPAPPFMMT